MAVLLCGCGCGKTTGSRFAVGHDSKYVSAMVAATLAGTIAEEAATSEVATRGSDKLATKYVKNLTKARDRQSQPAAAPRKSRPKVTSTDEASRKRAADLVAKLASMHLTGQVGTYRAPSLPELPAKVLGRNDDGTLRLRIGIGPGQVQDLPVVNPDHFVRHVVTIDDDAPLAVSA